MKNRKENKGDDYSLFRLSAQKSEENLKENLFENLYNINLSMGL